jgi:peptide/nickel transport system substrate-binding protein
MLKKFSMCALLVILGLIVSINIFASSTNKESSDAPTVPLKPTLVVAMKNDPKTLDPQRSIDTMSNKSLDLIYDSLFEYDENLNVHPVLVESWERPDQYHSIFRLKKGIKFHNGDELKAEDVKFTLERAAVSPQVMFQYNPIAEVIVIDDYTVNVVTKTPYGALIQALAGIQSGIVNKKTVEKYGDDYINHPIGTGQYKFKEWLPGNRIVFEGFDEYFRGAPKIKEITFRTIPEVSNRLIALETGEADMAFDVGLMDKDVILKNPNLELLEVESPSLLYLGFDQTVPKYQNKNLRYAIAYAIDNNIFVDTIFKGSAVAAVAPIAKASIAYNPNVKRFDQDVEKAKQYLKDAGYPNGLNLELWVSDDGPRIDMCVIIQDQLSAIGINAEIKVFEFGSYVSKTALSGKDLYFLSWNYSGDGDASLYPLFHSSQHGSSGNRSFYTNKEVDDLLDKARVSIDQNERTELYQKAQEIIQDDLPHYTLVYPMLNIAKNVKVKGLVFKKNGYINVLNTYVEK